MQPNSESVLILSGSDPDGDSIAFEVVNPPLHGQLSGTAPDLLYLPDPDYLGPDRFEFRVTDGFATSEPVVFSLQVARQNRVPKANDQTVITYQHQSKSFSINGSDPDGDALKVVILKGPRHGMIYGSGTNFTYVPKGSILGVDTLTYKLWDGQKFGNVGTVSVVIATPGEDRVPAFTSIKTLGGMVQLNLGVPQGRPFRIEASTNLADWFVLLPSTIANGTNYQFQDAIVTSPGRFYRAIRE